MTRVPNATAFATATANDDAGVLSICDCPILQVAQAGMSHASWEASTRGLNPRDLAMHVVLPEVDGRIFANAIAFKERGESLAGFAPTTFQPVADRIDATADLAQAWVRLRRAERSVRRIALVLANYPNRDGRLANGVGLDTPQSLIDVLAAVRGEGYLTDQAPDEAAAMMDLLQEGPTNALEGRVSRSGGVSWPLANMRLRSRLCLRTCSVPSNLDGENLSRTRMSWRRDFALACTASAISLSACSRRAVTISTPRAPITIPTWCRRITIWRSICGFGANSTCMPSCISASTAISNGYPARAPVYLRIAFRMRCWADPASVSLYRQRPRRGYSGQAPRQRGHYRSSDATDDPCRIARRPRAAGDAG